MSHIRLEATSIHVFNSQARPVLLLGWLYQCFYCYVTIEVTPPKAQN